MKLQLIVGAALIAVLVLTGSLWALNSPDVNVSKSMTIATGNPTTCLDGGFMELAGERERVYDCTVIVDHGPSYTKQHVCVWVNEGDVYKAGRERC